MPKFDKVDSVQYNSNESKKTEKEDITSPYYFPPKEDQLRQKDVALMFGRSVQTICAWTKSGKIPYFRLGKIPIYSKRQLILYASRNQSLISQ